LVIRRVPLQGSKSTDNVSGRLVRYNNLVDELKAKNL
jgi:hypothetical protein